MAAAVVGGARRRIEEPPPLGGLSIDWDKFEADFRSYSNAVTHV